MSDKNADLWKFVSMLSKPKGLTVLGRVCPPLNMGLVRKRPCGSEKMDPQRFAWQWLLFGVSAMAEPDWHSRVWSKCGAWLAWLCSVYLRGSPLVCSVSVSVNLLFLEWVRGWITSRSGNESHLGQDWITSGSGTESHWVKDWIASGSRTKSHLGVGPNRVWRQYRIALELSPLQSEFMRLINMLSVAWEKDVVIACQKLCS